MFSLVVAFQPFPPVCLACRIKNICFVHACFTTVAFHSTAKVAKSPCPANGDARKKRRGGAGCPVQGAGAWQGGTLRWAEAPKKPGAASMLGKCCRHAAARRAQSTGPSGMQLPAALTSEADLNTLAFPAGFYAQSVLCSSLWMRREGSGF